MTRRPLARDRRGATLVEFAMVLPVMCVLLLGGLDVSHTLYMRAVLQGIVQKTARDSSLESGTDATVQSNLDNRVRAQVHDLASNAQVDITRRYYRTFSDAAAARAEDFTDLNGNGRCDNGEPYEDANNNKVWDADGGDGGQGGAKDATVYTVTVTYPRMFPVTTLIGGSASQKVVATTVLRNQPYGDQGAYAAPVVRNCP